jgi:hypothetical protein
MNFYKYFFVMHILCELLNFSVEKILRRQKNFNNTPKYELSNSATGLMIFLIFLFYFISFFVTE